MVRKEYPEAGKNSVVDLFQRTTGFSAPCPHCFQNDCVWALRQKSFPVRTVES